MSGKRLLDTNIVVAFLTGDQQVQERLDAVPELLIPMVVLGELYYGAAHSGRPQENASAVESFARSCVLLGIDVQTAQLYGFAQGRAACKGSTHPRKRSLDRSGRQPAQTSFGDP